MDELSEEDMNNFIKSTGITEEEIKKTVDYFKCSKEDAVFLILSFKNHSNKSKDKKGDV